MSEPTGRPAEPAREPETVALPVSAPAGESETAALPVTDPTTQWAVASTGHPQTQPFGSSPEPAGAPTAPLATPAPAGATAGPDGAFFGTPVAGQDAGRSGTAPSPAPVHPGWHPGTEQAPTDVQGGMLPPGADGWGPQEDVVANGPRGTGSRRFPLGLAAAGGAVLIAGAAFAAGMAIGNHDDRLQNTAAGAPFGAPGQNGQGGQLGQGQLGQQGQQGQGQSQQGQQGQGGGQLGGPPNGGRLPDGIGQLVAAGVITQVQGSTLTVQGRNGLVTVNTSASTLVEDDLGGTVAGLQAGELIFVAGKVADDGTVTAMAIADRPFFAGIPGNRNGQNGNGQNGGGQDGQDGQDGNNQNTSGPGQDDGVTT